MAFFVLCVKKTNFEAKIGVAQDFFVFLYKTQKYGFFTKLGACTQNVQMYHALFLFGFFYLKKMFFPWEHMLPELNFR
jgi:hypothetical protein